MMSNDDKRKVTPGRIAKDSDPFNKRNESITGDDSNKNTHKPNQGETNKNKKPGQPPMEVKNTNE